jgi:hypothetical protein
MVPRVRTIEIEAPVIKSKILFTNKIINKKILR